MDCTSLSNCPFSYLENKHFEHNLKATFHIHLLHFMLGDLKMQVIFLGLPEIPQPLISNLPAFSLLLPIGSLHSWNY